MVIVLLITAVALFVYVGFQWVVSLYFRDASLVDRYWGGGFVLVTAITLLYTSPDTRRDYALLAMTAAWGLRLSLYLTWRNWGRGEDYRYQAMRARHGDRFPVRSLFKVFLLQGVLTWFISLPLQVGIAQDSVKGPTRLDLVGIAVWCVGVAFETIGDWQLAQFKANSANAGKVMDRGLWRYTRHPNYFGDAMAWWGMFLVAANERYGWCTVLSPILMQFLLMRVSGVTLLERKLVKTRPEYKDYIARTNAFFPGWPAKSCRTP